MARKVRDALDGIRGRLTTDPHDERLTRGVDTEPTTMADAYLVTDAGGWPRVRPLRRSYIHAATLGGCGAVTTMATAIADTYARRPHFYGATWCSACSMHRPVGHGGEFMWLPGEGEDEIPPEQIKVGS